MFNFCGSMSEELCSRNSTLIGNESYKALHYAPLVDQSGSCPELYYSSRTLLQVTLIKALIFKLVIPLNRTFVILTTHLSWSCKGICILTALCKIFRKNLGTARNVRNCWFVAGFGCYVFGLMLSSITSIFSWEWRALDHSDWDKRKIPTSNRYMKTSENTNGLRITETSAHVLIIKTWKIFSGIWISNIFLVFFLKMSWWIESRCFFS